MNTAIIFKMERVQFLMKYEGSALVNHEMDVKELSPALLALGELLEETNKVLNGGKTVVSVNVKAFRDGSLGVELSVIQDLVHQAVSLFGSPEITNALNLVGVLGLVRGSVKGLVWVIKWIRNRKIKNVVRLESGNIKIELEDGDNLEIDKEVGKVFPNVKIRRSLEMVITRPLEREGMDSISFMKDDIEEKIQKEEAAYFIAPEVLEEPIDEQEYEISLQIISAVFQEGNKWRFSDGTNSFYAEVQDREFIARVQSNAEGFAKDDILRVLILRKQFEISNGIRTEYFVKKVLEHKSALNTIRLPFGEKNENLK